MSATADVPPVGDGADDAAGGGTGAGRPVVRRVVSRVHVREDTGPIVIHGVSARWAPLAKQTLVAALVVGAAVASDLLPGLSVTDVGAVWWAAGLALLGLGCAALVIRWPALLRLELLLPALDFIVIGVLRVGTGGSRSVFLAIVVLPVIWMATNPGRRHVVYPVLGVCATLLTPYALHPQIPAGSEIARLVVAVFVYTAAATVTNELARQAGSQLDVALRQRRVAENEIVRAAVVQQALLPSSAADLPASVEAVGTCVPAKVVGGDFYDWFPTRNGAAFTLGDVMGKGVGSGMIATAVRSVIRSTADDDDAAHALRRAAIGLATGPATGPLALQFTTCFHLRVADDGAARWADAGHGLSVVRRADGTRQALRSADLPIGVGTDWSSTALHLEPGDQVVSISDGVLDLFGSDAGTVDRFWEFADGHPRAADLVSAVEELAGRTEHPDDVTILAVTYRGVSPRR